MLFSEESVYVDGFVIAVNAKSSYSNVALVCKSRVRFTVCIFNNLNLTFAGCSYLKQLMSTASDMKTRLLTITWSDNFCTLFLLFSLLSLLCGHW